VIAGISGEMAAARVDDSTAPAPRAELLHVLMLPDLERAERIGEFKSYPRALLSGSCRRVATRTGE
jgi:hypothetical protein